MVGAVNHRTTLYLVFGRISDTTYSVEEKFFTDLPGTVFVLASQHRETHCTQIRSVCVSAISPVLRVGPVEIRCKKESIYLLRENMIMKSQIENGTFSLPVPWLEIAGISDRAIIDSFILNGTNYIR